MNTAARRLRKTGLVVTALAALGIALSAAASAGAASATTWVVDNTVSNCSDKGPGTASQPFCTIAAGGKAALAGDTVLVRAGSYSGTSVNPTNSGVTFTANSGVTVSGGTTAFSISSRSDVVVSGFTITGTSSYGISVSGGSNVTISSNVESYAGTPISHPSAGIYLHNLAGGLVSNNVTHDNSAHGIYLNGSTTGVVVQGNTSYHNAYQYQRNANGIDDIAPGNSIIGNVTYSNEDSGINIYPGGNNALVAGNVSYHNGDHGIDDYNVSGGRVIGNTIYGNCTTGINVEGTGGSYLVENNVSMNNATGAVINPTTIAINPSTGAPYYTNNCNRRTGNIGIWDSQPLTSSADYNLVYQSNGTSPEEVWAGVVYNTQQALYAATGQEAHGIMADPLFANPGAWDFRLTGASPAVDSADSLASGEQPVDLLGHSRVDDPLVANTGNPAGSYYDRGAYEYGPPFALITASAESATTTQGIAVPVTLQGSDTAACELTFTIVSAPAHGTLGPISPSLCTAGSPNHDTAAVTYTPTAGYTGADSFTYQVSDGTSTSNTATVSLTVNGSGGGGGGNLVGNPGFETGLTGWNTSGSGSGVTLTQVAGGHSGNYAGLVTNTSSSNSGCTLNDAPNWVSSTSPGTYTGSLWVKADSPGAPLNLRFREYNGTTFVNSSTATVNLTTSWQQVTVTYTVQSPGSTLDFNAYLTSANSPPGTCFYADDASITLGSPPTAALSVSPTSGTAPVQVSADASASTGGSTAISSYSFDWGDGTSTGAQSGPTATHTYAGAGTYAVTVTVTDTDGTSATTTQQVTVNAGTPPTAALTVTPASGAAPLGVTADASGSTQGSTAISSYSFAWGDGSGATTQQGATATHTYTATGNYTVTVTVTDTDGTSATATQQVTVSAATPPTAALTVTPSSGVAPLAVTADASASTGGSTAISSYSFVWGDGTANTGPQPGKTANHTYVGPGNYTVTVTVTDTDGTSATATQQVTVSTTTPPTAALTVTPSSGVAPLAVTADASASTSGSTAISTYSFAWGDGTANTGPQGGATAMHTYTTAGTYTVTVTVTDTDGASAQKTQSVTVTAPTPPTAALTVTPNSGTAPLSVTANASGSTQGSTAISSYSFAWGDGTPITGPQPAATAPHTYATAGSYTVTVTVTDSDGSFATATQQVTVSSSGNLVGNSGFESDTGGWNTSGSGGGVTLTQVTGGHSGSYAALLTNTSNGKSGCTLNDSPNWVKTTSAGTYTGSIWVRADSAGAPLNLRFREYNGSKLVGSNTSTVTLSASWQQVTVTYTVSSPGTTLDFNAYLATKDSPSGTCFYADDASITLG